MPGGITEFAERTRTIPSCTGAGLGEMTSVERLASSML